MDEGSFRGQGSVLALEPVRKLPHTSRPGSTPFGRKRYERDEDRGFSALAVRYPRLSIDRETAEAHTHVVLPLFEAHDSRQDTVVKGVCFHWLVHDDPGRVDFAIVHAPRLGLRSSTSVCSRLS